MIFLNIREFGGKNGLSNNKFVPFVVKKNKNLLKTVRTSCKAELKDGAKFCNKYGAKVEATETAKSGSDARFEEAEALDKAKDYIKAAKIYEELAKQGHARAQNVLGFYFLKGNGVRQDSAKAFEWFSKAANQGNAEAQYHLGLCYENGSGVEQDSARAAELYLKAAQQGIVAAQFNLGLCYKYGEGVKQDSKKAFEWFLKAAEQGFVEAQTNLAFFYAQGEGVKQSEDKAEEWFRKAAAQGDDTAKQIIEEFEKESQDQNEQNELQFCSECGAKMQAGEGFCGECGAKQ